jgi:hypothetical protein
VSSNSVRTENMLLRTPIEINLMILIPCLISASCLSLPFTFSLTKMSKPIPLRATLRIELYFIVIDRPRLLMLNRMLELRSPEPRHFRLIQCPVSTYPDAVYYFFACGEGRLWCEAIQHPEFVCGAKETPGVTSRPIFFKGKGGERRCLGRHLRSC